MLTDFCCLCCALRIKNCVTNLPAHEQSKIIMLGVDNHFDTSQIDTGKYSVQFYQKKYTHTYFFYAISQLYSVCNTNTQIVLGIAIEMQKKKISTN